MIFDRWDIAVAIFPFAESLRSKPRPVVILSSRTFNELHDLVVTCMITTAPGGLLTSDVPISELAPTGLKTTSVLRLKVATLSTAIVARRIGSLSYVDRQKLRVALAAVLPLDQ